MKVSSILFILSLVADQCYSFKATLDLNHLVDRTDILKVNGVEVSDRNAESGFSVSNAGDVNGDGYDDVIIGAPYASPDSVKKVGVSYVVFGSPSTATSRSLDLELLDSTTGFAINGIAFKDESGTSVSSAGDINGDGYDDLLIGAYLAFSSAEDAGQSYVVFGAENIGYAGNVDLEDLDGSNGFIINGEYLEDYSGFSVSNAGDFNNDGYDDILIGAYGSDASGSGSGASYLLYGTATIGNTGTIELSSLDGSNGFVIFGGDAGDDSGYSLSGAGDFNGDGYDDIIIGAYDADGGGSYNGASYLIYGGNAVAGSGIFNFNSLDGSNGFVLNGASSGDVSGFSVSGAGDFNGDEYSDIIIGAKYGDGGATNSGESYLIYGGTSVGTTGSFDLSSVDGSNGFVLNGVGASDQSGFSVSGAGDFNNDGYDDVIIGAPYAENYDDLASSGESYLVLGGSTVGTSGSFDLSSLNGKNGFRIIGQDAGDLCGYSVSGAGDFNGDGDTDVIIGAYGVVEAGASYIIFDSTSPSSSSDSTALIVTLSVIFGLLFLGIFLIVWCCCCQNKNNNLTVSNNNTQFIEQPVGSPLNSHLMFTPQQVQVPIAQCVPLSDDPNQIPIANTK